LTRRAPFFPDASDLLEHLFGLLRLHLGAFLFSAGVELINKPR
jgi:hypothetical protein